MKITMILNNKEYERNGISAGDYEEFCDIRDTVNPDGDYSRDDIKKMREGLVVAFGGQFTAEELKAADAGEVVYQFMAVDAMVAAGLKEKVEKMKATFGIGE
ncbi:phage tail assembly chaperone G [Phascolarctobacterium sp.]|uniref:phage tail assembly chaperone G n=1 Tax=Phascolarctobacterium sp. TaxID=2049039 RepID=UPI00386A3D91